MREGWQAGVLGDFVEVNPREPPLQADAPFVPMDAVQAGRRWVQRFEVRGDRGGVRFKEQDTLFARITPCLENGKVAQVQTGVGRCGGSTEFIVLRAGPAVLPDVVYLWATMVSTR